MSVVILQHVDVEGPGRIGEVLDAAGIGRRTVRADLGEQVPADARDLAGLVLMGGPMGVYESHAHPFLAAELRLLESALRHGVPTLGVCLGSQLLAAALGARVQPGPAKEIGWLPVDLLEAASGDALLGGAPRAFTPLHWHGDVFDLPAGAAALARSRATPYQAFRYGTAWGLLFHLETNAEQVSRMAQRFAGELQAAGVEAAPLVAASASASAAIAGVAHSVFQRWSRLCAVRR